LADILQQAGHNMTVYDPIYADYPQALQNRYAFITCSEVIEHFRQPAQTFRLLFNLLEPNAHLAIMSKRVLDAAAFSRWHYKQDPTHISFYAEASLQWLAEHYQCQIVFVGRDVAIFQAPP
jgi:hypothetical protein